ncbi:hypothetical protein ACRU13_21745 [Mycobacterium colombiense]
MNEYEKSEPEFWTDLQRGAEQLRFATRQTRSLGLIAMVLTIFVLSVSVFLLAYVQRFRYGAAPYISLAPAAIAVVAAIVLMTVERAQRRSDAIFDELTEELQYRISLPGPDRSTRRAPVEARMAMRDYSTGRTLPFLPNRSGPGILLLVNILFAALPPIFLNMYQ